MTWMRCHWDEEVIWFYFEVDAEGWDAAGREVAAR